MAKGTRYTPKFKAIERIAKDLGGAGDAAPLAQQGRRHDRGGDQAVG